MVWKIHASGLCKSSENLGCQTESTLKGHMCGGFRRGNFLFSFQISSFSCGKCHHYICKQKEFSREFFHYLLSYISLAPRYLWNQGFLGVPVAGRKSEKSRRSLSADIQILHYPGSLIPILVLQMTLHVKYHKV